MKKYLILALVLGFCSCKKSNNTPTNNIVGKWMATSRTIVYSANNKELSRQTYTTTTVARTSTTITSFYYLFDASGNFGYYQYNLNTSSYALFEPGDKYTFTDPNLNLTTPSGGSSTAVVMFTDSNNITLTETYNSSYAVPNIGTATTETDLTYFTRNNQ